MRRPSRSRLRAQAQALADPRHDAVAARDASALARVGRQPTPSRSQLSPASRPTVVRPASAPPWPALVFMNGATPDGRRHPMVHRLSLALARAGRAASSSPTLPASPGASCRRRTLAQSVAVSEAASSSPETADGRVALVGVSVGGTLALLAAADARLQQRISVVACVAPFGDLADGDAPRDDRHAIEDGRRVDTMRRRRTSSSASRARSAAMLAVTPATARLCQELRALDHESSSPVELPERAFRGQEPRPSGSTTCSRTRDPDRFDGLYAALPDHVRAAVALAVAHPRRAAPSCTGRDRDRAAGQILPRRRSAGACRGLTARAAHRHVAARARNAAPRRAKRRRAAPALRVLRPRVQGCDVPASATIDPGADVMRSEWRSSPDATV